MTELGILTTVFQCNWLVVTFKMPAEEQHIESELREEGIYRVNTYPITRGGARGITAPGGKVQILRPPRARAPFTSSGAPL